MVATRCGLMDQQGLDGCGGGRRGRSPEKRRNHVKGLEKVVDNMLQIKSGIYNAGEKSMVQQ